MLNWPRGSRSLASNSSFSSTTTPPGRAPPESRSARCRANDLKHIRKPEDASRGAMACIAPVKSCASARMKGRISCESGAAESCGLDRRQAIQVRSIVSNECKRRTSNGPTSSSPTHERRIASRKQGSTAVGCGDELAGKVSTCRIVLHDRPRRRAGWWSCKLI